MLLGEEKHPFDDPEYLYELKLDGIRCLAYVERGKVTLRNKRNKDVTSVYPELSEIWRCVAKRCILDGELVVFTDGKPDFYAVQRRSLMADSFRIRLAAKKNPVQFVAYDILYREKSELMSRPLSERKKILSETVQEGYNLSLSRYIEGQGTAFFELTKREKLEGIVAKRKAGKYYPGKRTREQVKIKVMQDEDLLICGYEPGEGGEVKDLILGYYDGNGILRCRGKVYLGISREDKSIVRKFAAGNTVQQPHFLGYEGAVWLQPVLVGTVQYMHETADGAMRQPAFKGIRQD